MSPLREMTPTERLILEELTEFFGKASGHLIEAGDIPVAVYKITLGYEMKQIGRFSVVTFRPKENLIIVISGTKVDLDEIKKKILRELLRVGYPRLSNEELRRATEDFWWAYKTGKFAV